jgi:hypothetical protein
MYARKNNHDYKGVRQMCGWTVVSCLERNADGLNDEMNRSTCGPGADGAHHIQLCDGYLLNLW